MIFLIVGVIVIGSIMNWEIFGFFFGENVWNNIVILIGVKSFLLVFWIIWKIFNEVILLVILYKVEVIVNMKRVIKNIFFVLNWFFN